MFQKNARNPTTKWKRTFHSTLKSKSKESNKKSEKPKKRGVRISKGSEICQFKCQELEIKIHLLRPCFSVRNLPFSRPTDLGYQPWHFLVLMVLEAPKFGDHPHGSLVCLKHVMKPGGWDVRFPFRLEWSKVYWKLSAFFFQKKCFGLRKLVGEGKCTFKLYMIYIYIFTLI